MRAIRVHAHATAIVFAAALTAACGGSTPAPAPAEKIQPTTVGEMSPEEAGGMSAESSTLKEEAAATTPHGGRLVKLGDAAHLEFVHDPSSGTLTAYVLNAAGTAVMRVPAKDVAVTVTTPSGAKVPVVLTSTANGLTGDTVGNSSQFTGTAAALKGVESFTVAVTSAAVGGQTYKDVSVSYPH